MTAPWPAPLSIRAPGLALRHWPGWMGRVGLPSHGLDSQALARQLVATIPWQQPVLRVYGRLHAVPRLTCWLGDGGCTYRYSGLVHQPLAWTPALDALRRRLGEGLDCRFNSLLINRYRDGDDQMGWHADDEPELVRDHPIASLSLGASRCLRFRPRPPTASRPDGPATGHPPLNLELADGDLLVMDGPSQSHWQHALPARRRVRLERINLTFRRIAGG